MDPVAAKILLRYDTDVRNTVNGRPVWKAIFEGPQGPGSIEGVGASPEEAIGFLVMAYADVEVAPFLPAIPGKVD